MGRISISGGSSSTGGTPNIYRSDLATSETFTNATGNNNGGDHLIAYLTPVVGNVNYNPSGSFTDGYRVYVINLGTKIITFDSAGIARQITAGGLGIYFWDNTNSIWRS
ncbi:MAG: hypothetical protein ACTSO3_16890 [Candidatus Heimdallarchaeaceae archaeon]